MDVVDQIKNIMFERDISTAELARLSSISSNTIYRMLSRKSSPSIKTLQSIAEALDYNFKIRFEMKIDED